MNSLANLGQHARAQNSDTTASIPWTPAHHAKVNKAKPIRLLALGIGQHGKNARFEFPDGWQRTIDLTSEADGWHPLFSDLSNEERQKLHAHVEPPTETKPNGERRRQNGLSFTTYTLGRSGGIKAFNSFDVPAEDYGQGRITGYRCASELLDALKRGYGPHIDLGRIIEDAIKTAPEGFGRNTRYGAATALLDMVQMAVKFLATNGQYEGWIARCIEREEKNKAYWGEQEAKKKAEFVERMRSARAAKRAVRQGGDTHGG